MMNMKYQYINVFVFGAGIEPSPETPPVLFDTIPDAIENVLDWDNAKYVQTLVVDEVGNFYGVLDLDKDEHLTREAVINGLIDLAHQRGHRDPRL